MTIVCTNGKSPGNRLIYVKSRTEFRSEMGFEPIMRRGYCHCDNKDCLCLIDPFATAEKNDVNLDIGDKHDAWNYLFIAGERYSRPPEHVVRWIIRNWEPSARALDDWSNSLNPNNPAYSATIENRANQLNPNNPEYKGKRQ